MTTSEADPNTLDLRSGRTVWELTPEPTSPSTPLRNSFTADLIVIGAGITGAFIAERLTRAGRDVVVLDRNTPQRASTAASTALLQWELDAPMLALEDRLGFETAAAIYRRSVESVRSIGALHLDPACGFAPRRTLYLAGDVLDPSDLHEEKRLRDHAGIHGAYLDALALRQAFGVPRDAGLLHEGAAEANPVRMARALLDRAIARGARVFSPALIGAYDCGSTGVTIGTDDGVSLSGKALILANGYEMPPFLTCVRHDTVSTWAIATRPQPSDALPQDMPLVWEASEPYAYMRTTPEGRIVFGGEDEPITDADARDALIAAKSDALQRKLKTLAPSADLTLDAAWTGFFGASDDALPFIGAVPGVPHCYAAFGYGGNGITFSAMAADLIATLLRGETDPALDWFAVDR